MGEDKIKELNQGNDSANIVAPDNYISSSEPPNLNEAQPNKNSEKSNCPVCSQAFSEEENQPKQDAKPAFWSSFGNQNNQYQNGTPRQVPMDFSFASHSSIHPPVHSPMVYSQQPLF